MNDRALFTIIENLKDKFYSGQQWILNPMKVMDFYPYSAGVCDAFSHVAADMFLKNQMPLFYRVLAHVNKSSKSLPEQIEKIIDKRNQLVCSHYPEIRKDIKSNSEAQIKKNILSDMSLKCGRNLSDETELNTEQKKLFDELGEEQLSLLFSESEKQLEQAVLTQQERDMLQIAPLFNSIYIHQYTQFLTHLFENKSSVFTSNRREATLSLAQSISRQNDSNLVKVGRALNIYTKETLSTALKLLKESFDQNPGKTSVSFILNSPDHAIFIGYDTHNQYWHFININKMPGEIIESSDITKLVSSIFEAFSNQGAVLLNTELYALNEKATEIDYLKTAIDCLQQSVAWKRLQITSLDKNNLINFTKIPFSSYGYNLLQFAAQENYFEIVNTLLSYPEVDIDALSGLKRTALSHAAEYGNLDIVNLLLRHNANVNLDVHILPICIAAEFGHADVVASLLPKVSSEMLDLIINGDNSGKCLLQAIPFHSAAEQGHSEVIKVLLTCPGINVNQVTRSGETALMSAAKNNHLDVVLLLLSQKGINPNIQDNYKDTPLFEAISNGHYRIVEALLSHSSIDLTIQNEDGNTVFVIAKRKGYSEITRLLENYRAELNKNQTKSSTSLGFFQEKSTDSNTLQRNIYESVNNLTV